MQTEIVEEKKLLFEEGSVIEKRAHNILVEDPEQYKDAREFLGRVRDFRKKIEDFMDPHCKRAHQAWKALTTDRAILSEPLERSQRMVSKKLGDYEYEQEQRKRAQDAQIRKEQEDRRLEEAAALEEAGAKEEAAALIEQPVIAPPSAAAVEKFKDGVRSREVWSLEVFDEFKVPRQYLKPDEKVLRGMVLAQKSKFNVPGCRAVKSKTHY